MDSSAITDHEENGAIADSPTVDQGAGEPASTLEDAIAGILDGTDEETNSEPLTEENGEEEQEAKPSEPRNADEEEDANVPFHRHPRWQEVNRQLKEARQTAEASREKIDRFERLSETVQERGLTVEDLDQGLAILSALKNPSAADAKAALQAFVPVIQRLQKALGEVVDDDLIEDVREQRITRERAQEIARLRADRERTEQETQRLTRESEDAAKGAMVRAVADVEATWKSDPDYGTKLPLIQAKVTELIVQHGHPRNPQEAQALANEAKRQADAYFSQLRPAPKPKATITGGTSRQASTTPRTLDEALDRAFRDMAGK